MKIIATAAVFICFSGCKNEKQPSQESKQTSTPTESLEENLETLGDDDFDYTATPSTQLLDPIEISFGDMETMRDFSTKAQNNGYADGQIVTIDGVLSHGFSSLSVGQEKDGTYIGTSLEVAGWEESDWPEDGSRIKVKATLKMNTDYYFLYLTANPEDVTVISGPEY